MENAILLFLKFPEPGRVKTRLAAHVGPVEAARIYRELVTHTFAALPTNATCVICYDPPESGEKVRAWLAPLMHPGSRFLPQASGDLGERLKAAFQWAFAEGFATVTAVGTDCPDLGPELFEEAWEGLKAHDCVLGPATDGGYYLLALHAPHPELFEGIAWSTEHTLSDTLARAETANLRVALLPERRDIDTFEDWENFVKSRA